MRDVVTPQQFPMITDIGRRSNGLLLPFRAVSTSSEMDKHFHHSSFREKLIEHLLIGELLKRSWKHDCSLEISKPEVDRKGYDLVAEYGSVIRHIQLKGSYLGAKTAYQKVHVALSAKPSGCIVWVYFNEETLELWPFCYFGGSPGAKLPSIESFKVATHTKGNAQGHKAERPDMRKVPKGKFVKHDTVEELWDALFGSA